MAPKKKTACRAVGCQRPLSIEGYCSVHGPEILARRQAREDGLQFLRDGTVDRTVARESVVCEERPRLARWWWQACDAAIHGRADTVLGDEAEYAAEWCIARAGDLAKRERAARAGEREHPLTCTDWVWERFAALEAGLRSNGTPRSRG